jgi:hypothetical protein
MSDPLVIATVRKNGSEEVRVALDNFRDIDLLDIRVYAEFSAGGERKATKRGVSVRVDRLPALIDALLAAAEEARRRGLLPERGVLQ